MLHAWHYWVMAGFVLWIAEIFTPGFVLGVFGTSCFFVALAAWAGLGFKVQLLVFGIATVIISLSLRPLILKFFYGGKSKIKTNVDALLDQAGFVVEAIDPAAGTGRVKVGGEPWRAVSRDESPMQLGQKVKVLAVEGCTVVVEPFDKTEKSGG